MSAHRFWQIIRLLKIISEQVHHCENKLDVVLQSQGVTIPPELIKAGQDLAAKRKDLQAALDAQAQQPTQKAQ